MERKQATLFGATGLIGGYLLDIILEDPYFNHVIVVSRRSFSKKHPKMDTRIIDFSTTKQIEQSIVNSDFVFSAIGTTQEQVKGDKSAYRKIDFDITLSIAMACKKMNIKSFLFVSSSGANSSSASFYMKLKGKIDEEVFKLNLISAVTFRPSLLIGKRKEYRFGEKIAQFIMPFLAFLFPNKLKPIPGSFVAEAMIHVSKNSPFGNEVVENRDLIIWKKTGFDS